MGRATKDSLLRKRKVTTREVDLDETGTVVVRGLKRAEVIEIRNAATKNGRLNEDLVDLFTIVRGMVDPVLTPDEVAEWAEQAPAGEPAKVMAAIGEMSGYLEGADKSGLPGIRG